MKGTGRLVVIDSVWGHMGKLDLPVNWVPFHILSQPEEDPTNKTPISW